MAVTFTTRNKFTKPNNFEEQNLWGTHLNADFDLIDAKLSGHVNVPMNDAAVTLTDPATANSQNRQAVISFTGALTANRTVTVPNAENTWVMSNQTTGGYSIDVRTAGSSTPVTIHSGEAHRVWSDGTRTHSRFLPTRSQVVRTDGTSLFVGSTTTALDDIVTVTAGVADFGGKSITVDNILVSAETGVPVLKNSEQIDVGSGDSSGNGGTFEVEGGIPANGGAARFRMEGPGLVHDTITANAGGGRDHDSIEGMMQFSTTGQLDDDRRRGVYMSFRTAGTTLAQIVKDGVSASFVQSSDERLKERVVALDGNEAADRVSLLKPRKFRWKESGLVDTGFIAQEVQKVLPDAVHAGTDGYLMLDQTKFIPYLVAEIRNLRREVEELKAKKCECGE